MAFQATFPTTFLTDNFPIRPQGIISYPTRYEAVGSWSVAGADPDSAAYAVGDGGGVISIWRPVPPPGYVALGFVGGAAGSSEPPPLTAVGCLAAAAVVEGFAGECFVLPPEFTAAAAAPGHLDVAAASAAVSGGGGGGSGTAVTGGCRVWRLQNQAATFVVTGPGQPLPAPVGVWDRRDAVGR